MAGAKTDTTTDFSYMQFDYGDMFLKLSQGEVYDNTGGLVTTTNSVSFMTVVILPYYSNKIAERLQTSVGKYLAAPLARFWPSNYGNAKVSFNGGAFEPSLSNGATTQNNYQLKL